MEVFAVWYGGPSYSTSDIHKDRERFPSIRAAERAFLERYESNGQYACPTFYINREPGNLLFPAVTEESEMEIYATATADEPWFRLTFGPRGGIRREYH